MTEQEAHDRIIAAMCPQRVCRICGEPSRRVVGEAEYVNPATGKPSTTLHFSGRRRQEGENHWDTSGQGSRAAVRVAPTVGWSDCGHDDWRPGKWFDPFQNLEGVMLTLGNIDEK